MLSTSKKTASASRRSLLVRSTGSSPLSEPKKAHAAKGEPWQTHRDLSCSHAVMRIVYCFPVLCFFGEIFEAFCSNMPFLEKTMNTHEYSPAKANKVSPPKTGTPKIKRKWIFFSNHWDLQGSNFSIDPSTTSLNDLRRPKMPHGEESAERHESKAAPVTPLRSHGAQHLKRWVILRITTRICIDFLRMIEHLLA